MSSAERDAYEVIIVGYGPVGSMLACLLGMCGVRVAVIDRDTEVFPIPRAGHFDDEIVRLLQTVGVADRLVPTFESDIGYHFFDRNWNQFLTMTGEGYGDQGWLRHYMFFQPLLEQTLRERNGSLPEVTVLLGHEVTGIEPRVDHVRVRVRGLQSGEQRELESAYVVGADGAHSYVRKVMDVEHEDLGGDQDWLLIHLRLLVERTDLPSYSFEWCNPERPTTYITPFPTGIKLFEFRLLPGETREEMERHERVWELLARWVRPDQAELLRADVYRFHSRFVREWRSGRLLLAGDAAHEMTPKLGQGLCSGLRDAANLAWKLARVVKGISPDSLLDTYGSERTPHVRLFIELSNELIVRMAEMAVRPELWTDEPQEMGTPRPPLGPGIHLGEPPAGILGPQPRLSDGRLLDDVTGYEFAVLLKDGLISEVDATTRTRWDSLGAAVVVDEGQEVNAAFGALGAKAAVLRPDRYIAGVANTAGELERLTEQLAAIASVPVP